MFCSFCKYTLNIVKNITNSYVSILFKSIMIIIHIHLQIMKYNINAMSFFLFQSADS